MGRERSAFHPGQAFSRQQRPNTFTQTHLSLSFFACNKAADHTFWIASIRLTRCRHALAIGEPVSDFTLTDQTGQRVALSRFAGKVVGVTFIYTTCALPNYCF